jgi:GT2 family glycosyltransferase
VSWNAKAFLLKCIESVYRQGFSASAEIIVVDNASTDGSPEAIMDAYPGVRLIRNNDNQGFARANNLGILASNGDYIFLINSDVVVLDGCFAKMVHYMDSHERVGVLGPRILGSDGQTQRSCMGYPSLWNEFSRALALDSIFPRSRLFGSQLMTFWSHDETRPVEVINGCFWMVRRRAVEQVGLLDERFLIYSEDVDWCRRFNDGGWEVVFFADAEAVHYGGASSANSPVKFYVEKLRANHQYWLKHHSRVASVAALAIALLHQALRLVGGMILYPVAPKRRAASVQRVARSVASMRWLLSALVRPIAAVESARRSL